jgi:HPt (histidine-containing phosphotransfer) domain-containing protein
LAESSEVEVPRHGQRNIFNRQQSANYRSRGISQLSRDSSPEQVDELIDMFLDTLERNLTSMRAAMAKGDAPPLAQLAHGAKGTAASMGATYLAALCRELEESAKRGLLEEVYPRFEPRSDR